MCRLYSGHWVASDRNAIEDNTNFAEEIYQIRPLVCLETFVWTL